MSLLLNCSMDWAATTDAGRLFHRQMVLGKKEYRDAEILWWCLWNCMGWPLVVDVDGTFDPHVQPAMLEVQRSALEQDQG